MSNHVAYPLFLNLMHEIEQIVQRDYYEQTNKLIHLNNKALNYAYNAFRHDGKNFYLEVYPSSFPSLHESLHEQYEAITRSYKEFQTEKVYVHAYLSLITTAHCNLPDTLALLPPCLHSITLNMVQGYYPEKGELEASQIEEIKSRHAKAYNIIETQMVLNLIGG